MNIFLFGAVFAIIMLIVEIATVALKLTGLSSETARFQTISLITNTGFTTREAELITRDRIRRRVASFLMLSFYVYLPFLIATLINSFQQGIKIRESLILAVIFFVFYMLLKKDIFLPHLRNLIENFMVAHDFIPQQSLNELLSVDSEYKIMQVKVENKSLTHIPLTQMALQNREITVLVIERANELIKRVKGHNHFELGDVLMIYGHEGNIRQIFGCNEDSCQVMDLTMHPEE